MKKNLIVLLYAVIFILIAVINVISIKKFFDKKVEENDIKFSTVNNYVVEFISYNPEKAEDLKETENNAQVIETTEAIENVETQEVVTTTTTTKDTTTKFLEIPQADKKEEKTTTNILFDNLTEQELLEKLNRNLKNELAGTGTYFVEYYKKTGLDPYLAIAIILHETGCTWSCSDLVKTCYNFGGLKGGEKKYNNTNYTCYGSKEEGINAFLNILYNNYYSQGLTTAELINPKYASSLTWAAKINNYINKIKNN